MINKLIDLLIGWFIHIWLIRLMIDIFMNQFDNWFIYIAKSIDQFSDKLFDQLFGDLLIGWIDGMVDWFMGWSKLIYHLIDDCSLIQVLMFAALI